MRTQLYRVSGLVAVFVLALGAATIDSAWLEGNAEKRERFKEIENKPAPALAVENFINGDAVTLEQLKGKVVLLDFWATWCGPCISAIPHTNELQAKYKDKGLVIIGVCHPRGVEKMAAVAKEKGIQYMVAADKDGATGKSYQVDSYPDYYFIDRQGNLRICDCSNKSVEDAAKALLEEGAKPASVDASK